MKLNFFIACSLFLISPLGFSDSYQKGYYYCSSFKEAREKYKADPDSVFSGMWYASCLLLQEGRVNEGLGILHYIVNKHNNVKAASMLAEYIKSGGAFTLKTDKKNIDEAIAAYQKVLLLINSDPGYPGHPGERDFLYEMGRQIELTSIYTVPVLYHRKFVSGYGGSDNQYLLLSPSYTGDRNLDTYPEYSPYTIDSLRKTIQFADRCLALPKKDHFRSDYYKDYREACQILKDRAIALLPLEQRRLTLLTVEACRRDILKCSEYDGVINEMISINKQATSKINKIFDNSPPATASASQ